MPDEINPIQWDALQLDPYNPRLPEKLQGSDEEQIFSFLVENENAIELAQSMVETGFFQHEPLLVAPKANDKHIVLEGNRRLTALMLIHNALPQVATAESLGLSVTQDQRARLLQIPCLEISDPNSIKAYVGYRHVSGVKPWSPEAKARFVVAEVDRHHVLGTPDPFKEVGRAIGSNALGVRNSYVALRSLVVARETFGVSVDFVLLHRFGVWMRCLNVPGVLKHIGLVEIPKKYEDYPVPQKS